MQAVQSLLAFLGFQRTTVDTVPVSEAQENVVENEKDEDVIPTKPCPLLKCGVPIDLTREPTARGLFTVVSVLNGPKETEVEPEDEKWKVETPKKEIDIPNYEVDEDGLVVGMIWPYTESALRGTRSTVPDTFNIFSGPFVDRNAIPPQIPLSPPQSGSPRTPTKRILIPDNSPTGRKKTRLNCQKPWYEVIDPEVYEQSISIFTYGGIYSPVPEKNQPGKPL